MRHDECIVCRSTRYVLSQCIWRTNSPSMKCSSSSSTCQSDACSWTSVNCFCIICSVCLRNIENWMVCKPNILWVLVEIVCIEDVFSICTFCISNNRKISVCFYNLVFCSCPITIFVNNCNMNFITGKTFVICENWCCWSSFRECTSIFPFSFVCNTTCLLYTSDAADE